MKILNKNLNHLNYSENQKTPEQKDDFETQVLNLYSPLNMRHRNCAV